MKIFPSIAAAVSSLAWKFAFIEILNSKLLDQRGETHQPDI